MPRSPRGRSRSTPSPSRAKSWPRASSARCPRRPPRSRHLGAIAPAGASLDASVMIAPRFLALAATALACASAHAGFADRFKDPEDGAFDASEYLLDHRGVLPLPIL